MAFERILVPTDFSDVTHNSIACARKCAGSKGAAIYLLAVSDDVTLNMPTTSQEFRDAAEEKLAGKLHSSTDADEQGNCEFHYEVRSGTAADEILRFADENDIELIVIGKTGRSALADVLLGSIAKRVIHEAHVPVMIVHAS